MPTYNEAPAVSLVNKIVSDFTSATWTPSGGSPVTISCSRVYFAPKYEPTDTTLHVDAMILGEPDEELADRGGSDARVFVVAVGVQKVMTSPDDPNDVEVLINLCEAIRTFYDTEVNFTVTGSQVARCTRREVTVIHSPEELQKNARFLSEIHLTFEGWYQ